MATIKASQLIKRAYAKAQIIDPREEIEGFQSSEGLDALNEIIDQWSSLQVYIPTYKEITISVVAGTYQYVVTPVITQALEAHLLDANGVQFPVEIVDLKRYNTFNFTVSAISPVRPQYLFVNNDFANLPTQSQVEVFGVPDAAYTLTLYAKVQLTNLAYSDTMTTYPSWWLRALRYELANELSETYGTILPERFYRTYDLLMRQVKAAAKKDTTVQVRNIFQNIRRFRPWGTYVD